MGGNAGAGGMSGLLGGSGQSFDPTTGAPIGSPPFSDWGGAYSGNPANPAVTEQTPTQAAQNIQAASYDPTTGQPTASPTGQPSGPSTPGWVQNLSNMFLGGQGSPAAQAGLTGGRGGATPAPQTPVTALGAPTAQTPGATAAATPPASAPAPADTSATVSPQSAPVSGKTQAVSDTAAAAPAPETAPAPAASDTTNYPDVAGTSRESGAGPGGAGAYNNPAFATPAEGGLPPVLQDLFTLNFGRFISDLLAQQGMPPGQNMAAAPRPSTDTGAATGDTGAGGATTDKSTADAGQKAQTPAQKAAGAISAVGEAVKPKPSAVDTTPTTATTPQTGAGAAGTATAAPTTPAGAAPGAPAAGQPTTGATAPTTTAGPGGTNLMGTGFFDPRATQSRLAGPGVIAPPTAQVPGTPGVPAAPAAGAPAAPTAAAPAAAEPGGPGFAAWRDFQLRNSDPETRRMYLENQARPDTAAPVTTGGQAPGAAGASRPPAGAPGPLNQPPGGQPTPDGGRAPTNGMPGGLTPNAPPALPGLGATPNQQNRPRHYEGTLTMPDGTKYRYGTGGGQFASAPYGTYQVHPGAVGSIGKSIGAWAGYSDSSNPGNNTVHDPLYKGGGGTSARNGVEIHPDVSGRRLITNGCIGIDRGQSAAFGRSFKAAARQGPLMMTIKPGGEITVFYANSQQPAVAGPGNVTMPPPNAPPKFDPRYGRAGVVSG